MVKILRRFGTQPGEILEKKMSNCDKKCKNIHFANLLFWFSLRKWNISSINKAVSRVFLTMLWVSKLPENTQKCLKFRHEVTMSTVLRPITFSKITVNAPQLTQLGGTKLAKQSPLFAALNLACSVYKKRSRFISAFHSSWSKDANKGIFIQSQVNFAWIGIIWYYELRIWHTDSFLINIKSISVM